MYEFIYMSYIHEKRLEFKKKIYNIKFCRHKSLIFHLYTIQQDYYIIKVKELFLIDRIILLSIINYSAFLLLSAACILSLKIIFF